MELKIQNFFDPITATHTYLVWDTKTRKAVVIDPVVEFDLEQEKTSTSPLQPVIEAVREHGLSLELVLETHAHADHLSGSQVIKKIGPQAKIAINRNIIEVQKIFAPKYNLANQLKYDGSEFDFLLNDGQTLSVGPIEIKVLFTPGHTPACTTFIIEKNLFVGDTIFLPDVGTGRCDFPGGSASTLYHSIHEKLYKLSPDHTVFVGHDYPPAHRKVEFSCSLKDQMEKNVHLKLSTTKEEFVQFREGRDKTLKAPRLIEPSLRVNIQAGRLPTEWS